VPLIDQAPIPSTFHAKSTAREVLEGVDCSGKPIVEEPNHEYGVMRYALDREAAARLWRECETLIDRKLPFAAR